ncbi:hypothetical protein [Candidatus Nitronereus thalassa]|uniref:Nucleoside phosphorylase domain-containing protein n=1 Tax=Candidatus Nitronereus thalassa TaxID=3020898 RepID=A0ABU3KAV5_9BACT|nr:hypothetical protein [Candidatus Nitronereus thalassa]MDT7043545.1 hypothetical protein [Candidatus Nitronereus thalassa]
MVVPGRKKSVIRPNSPEGRNNGARFFFIAILSISTPNLECLLQRIAIFTATRWEFQAIQQALAGGRTKKTEGLRQYTVDWPSGSATVIQTGIGLQKAKKACRQILTGTHYDLAISSGFAGALISSSIGALVIPNVVVLGRGESAEGSESFSYHCNVEYSSIIRRVQKSLNLQCVSDALVSVSWIVCSASEKRALSKKYQASALDMESAGIAAVAQEYQVPFLVIRTVSDLNDETLPQEFNFFLSPTFWMKGLWRMVSRPALWWHVYRLRQQSKVASRELTRFFEMFVTHLRQRETCQL